MACARRQERRGFGVGHFPGAKIEGLSARNEEAEQQESPRTDEIPEGKSGRYIAVAIRRQVYERAQGRCEFVGRTGRRCACTARLEIDHIDPFCGGNHRANNLRLLCDPPPMCLSPARRDI